MGSVAFIFGRSRTNVKRSSRKKSNGSKPGGKSIMQICKRKIPSMVEASFPPYLAYGSLNADMETDRECVFDMERDPDGRKRSTTARRKQVF